MKCLILAAGYATRLYPLTENFPKPLLKVGEKSILDWLVDDLVDTTDIDEFVVISNHKFAQNFEDWKSNKQKTILIPIRCSMPKIIKCFFGDSIVKITEMVKLGVKIHRTRNVKMVVLQIGAYKLC